MATADASSASRGPTEMVGIVCEHGILERHCQICDLHSTLNQYREIILRFFLNEEDEFQHLNDLVFALREIDPDFDKLFEEE